MGVKITIIIVVGVICCIVGSAGVTVYVMHSVKQSELGELATYYQTRTTNLTVYFQNEIYTLQENLSDLEEEVYNLNLSLQEKISELESLKSGDNYYMHDPTYTEVASFIANDKTDEISYDIENFDCQHFSKTVNDNAENRGIRCAIVIIYFEETNTGHMIIGFNTTDQGMVYVEPQSDEWVEDLTPGNEYWTDCIVPKGGYTYSDDPDDTIKEIIIFW